MFSKSLLGRFRTGLQFLSLSIVTITAAAVHAANAPSPVVQIGESRIVISNVSPGATIGLFGAGQEYTGAMELMRWRTALEDNDRDGSVEFDLTRPVPRDSVWIAIDAASSATAIAAPEGSQFERISFPSDVLKKGAGDKLELFVTGRRMIDLLVVRPHVGMWVAAAMDGFDNDGDAKHDGRTTVVFSRSENMIGRAPAPAHLTPRDVVVAIDVRRMQYYLTEVTE